MSRKIWPDTQIYYRMYVCLKEDKMSWGDWWLYAYTTKIPFAIFGNGMRNFILNIKEDVKDAGYHIQLEIFADVEVLSPFIYSDYWFETEQ